MCFDRFVILHIYCHQSMIFLTFKSVHKMIFRELNLVNRT